MELNTHLRVVPDQTNLDVWNIDSSVAIRIDVTNARNGPCCFFEAMPGETIWEAIKKSTPWFEPNGVNPFHRTKLETGQYHPRIARPSHFKPNQESLSLPS